MRWKEDEKKIPILCTLHILYTLHKLLKHRILIFKSGKIGGEFFYIPLIFSFLNIL